jgi:hypothetical protein
VRRVAALLTASLLLLAACGDADDGDLTGTDGTTTTVDDTTDAEETTTTTTEVDDTTTTTTTAEPGELPGERFEMFPFEDAELAVVGVEADDELNVRSGPGVSFDVVLTLDPLAEGVVATGHNRILPGGDIWVEVRAGGRTGWANSSFLSHLGVTDDITSQLGTPAELPRAATMTELARVVGEGRAPDAEMDPDIVVVDGPSEGDLAEVVVDVLGYPDDAVLGERLRIFARPDGNSFALRTVEATVLCRRGVTDDGLCI